MSGRRQNKIEAQAAEWVVRLGAGPIPAEHRRVLDRWLAENPAHAAAFDRARSLWAEFALLRTASGVLADDIASPGSRPLFAAPERNGTGAAVARFAAVVALVLVAVGLGAFWLGDPLLALEADYRTAPGEIRSVTLADGSTVQLDTDSALGVHFSRQERRVELLSGEAFFTVVPMRDGEKRSFIVQAANGTTKALGTQFMVEREANGGEVTVAEHQVEVSAVLRGDSEARSVVLLPGQKVHYDPISGIGAVTQTDLDQTTAWRRGRLIFDKVRLADVVVELNRYRRGRIIIADLALANRRVSGVFETAELPAALATITRELKARTATLPPFLTVLY